MGYGDFSPELCEQLHKVRKTIASRIAWKANGPNVLFFQAKVLTPDGTALDLSGYWNKAPRHGHTRWGFTLSFYGHCVRSYDMAQSHKNPGESGRIKGPHKHKYSSSRIPRYAYKPDPAICDDNPNKALLDFLDEENIEAPHNYQFFMFP